LHPETVVSRHFDPELISCTLYWHGLSRQVSGRGLSGWRAAKAGGYAAFLSPVLTRGVRVWEAWSTLRKQHAAASASRVALSLQSRVAPVASTARYRSYHGLLIVLYVSSTRDASWVARRYGRHRWSNSGASHGPQRNTVVGSTNSPRARARASPSRYLKASRRYQRTQSRSMSPSPCCPWTGGQRVSRERLH
jgi:hypothetical protein